MKVDFMIIGAMKSGTTSLSFHLSNHPEVCFCLDKEPNYFSRNVHWEEGLKGYHALYKARPGQKLGEASTMYTMKPEHLETEERIYQYNPDIKLIYIMRDPVERMTSQYAHNYVRKRVKPDLMEEVADDSSYITRSRYYYQITPYLRRFGADQVMIFTFEEYIKDPKTKLLEISKFIGIDPYYFEHKADFSARNQSSNRRILADRGISKVFGPIKKYGHRYMPMWLKQFLLNLFGNKIQENPKFPESFKNHLYQLVKDDVHEMEKLLGRKLNEWRIYTPENN